MRRITKKHSTKPERIVYEVLKELRIPFRHRWIVQGREVDFIFKNVALEIDGHEQDGEKNRMLAEEGYIPIHLHNSEINKEQIKELIKQI
jgi:very-short-patch-repair endonuclease